MKREDAEGEGREAHQMVQKEVTAGWRGVGGWEGLDGAKMCRCSTMWR